MFHLHRKAIAIIAALTLVSGAAFPALAQLTTAATAGAEYPQNTVTVTGFGTIHAAPDIATVDVGVDLTRPTVAAAFSEANTTVQAIIAALTQLGIAPEDIQTSNLSVYSTTMPSPSGGADQPAYEVSNTVHVTVRDINQAEAVIDAAIQAGATSLYGLSFGIADPSALETQARELAMQDAARRAGEYAALAHATLGDALVITESQNSAQPIMYAQRSVAGAGSAVVATGQTDVQVQVSVTYRLVRSS